MTGVSSATATCTEEPVSGLRLTATLERVRAARRVPIPRSWPNWPTMAVQRAARSAAAMSLLGRSSGVWARSASGATIGKPTRGSLAKRCSRARVLLWEWAGEEPTVIGRRERRRVRQVTGQTAALSGASVFPTAHGRVAKPVGTSGPRGPAPAPERRAAPGFMSRPSESVRMRDKGAPSACRRAGSCLTCPVKSEACARAQRLLAQFERDRSQAAEELRPSTSAGRSAAPGCAPQRPEHRR